MKIAHDELKALMIQLLTSKYYSQDEAEKIAEVFLYAELTGKKTMGVMKLLGSEPAQNIQPKYLPKVVKETVLSALIDGGVLQGLCPHN